MLQYTSPCRSAQKLAESSLAAYRKKVYGNCSDEDYVKAKRSEEKIEKWHCSFANALACPGTVVVQVVNADTTFIAVTRIQGP